MPNATTFGWLRVQGMTSMQGMCPFRRPFQHLIFQLLIFFSDILTAKVFKQAQNKFWKISVVATNWKLLG